MTKPMVKRVYRSAVVVLILGLVWIPILAGEMRQDHSKHGGAAMPMSASDKQSHAGHMAHVASLGDALKAIDAARMAVEANDKTKALTHLKKARELVAASHEAMVKAQAVVNVRCPIMGGKVDPKKLSPKLTRTFKGGKVGFCCGQCLGAWDKLSDEDKEQKLRKSVAADAQGQGKAMDMDMHKKKGHGGH